MRKLTAGRKHDIEAHHILEKRFLEAWGESANDGPAVVLTYAEHTRITSALRQRTYGIPKTEAAKPQLWQAYQAVYGDLGYSEWLSDIAKYFR